jgi:hypothetical protein
MDLQELVSGLRAARTDVAQLKEQLEVAKAIEDQCEANLLSAMQEMSLDSIKSQGENYHVKRELQVSILPEKKDEVIVSLFTELPEALQVATAKIKSLYREVADEVSEREPLAGPEEFSKAFGKAYPYLDGALNVHEGWTIGVRKAN